MDRGESDKEEEELKEMRGFHFVGLKFFEVQIIKLIKRLMKRKNFIGELDKKIF